MTRNPCLSPLCAAFSLSHSPLPSVRKHATRHAEETEKQATFVRVYRRVSITLPRTRYLYTTRCIQFKTRRGRVRIYINIYEACNERAASYIYILQLQLNLESESRAQGWIRWETECHCRCNVINVNSIERSENKRDWRNLHVRNGFLFGSRILKKFFKKFLPLFFFYLKGSIRIEGEGFEKDLYESNLP